MTDTKQIRQQMKQDLGYNARQVTVRKDGISLVFTVRDPEVDFGKVQSFGKGFEKIHRDQFGSILRGGNRFVDVEVSKDVHEAWKKRYQPAVRRAAVKLKMQDSLRSLVRIEGTPYFLGRTQWDDGYSLWGDSHILDFFNIPQVAGYLGRIMPSN